MSRNSNLKLAMADVDPDFSTESAAVDEAMEQAAQDIETALETIQTEQAPSRITSAREWTDLYLDGLAKQEKEFQTQWAAADADFETTVAEAAVKRDRIKSEISPKLKRTTALRAATTIYQGELRKAEL